MQKDCWPLLFVLNLRHLGFLPIGNNPCPVGRRRYSNCITYEYKSLSDRFGSFIKNADVLTVNKQAIALLAC